MPCFFYVFFYNLWILGEKNFFFYVSKVTTQYLKLPKMWKERRHNGTFFAQSAKKTLAKSQSPLQELEGGPRGPYLLVNTKIYLDIIRVDTKSKMQKMPNKNLKKMWGIPMRVIKTTISYIDILIQAYLPHFPKLFVWDMTKLII